MTTATAVCCTIPGAGSHPGSAGIVADVICPKCSDVMRTVDRQGIHIEQCANCRGIFLDHGELEQVLAAEQRYYGAAPVYEPPAGYPRQQPRYEDRGDHRSYDPRYQKRKKRKDFLEDLFDF